MWNSAEWFSNGKHTFVVQPRWMVLGCPWVNLEGVMSYPRGWLLPGALLTQPRSYRVRLFTDLPGWRFSQLLSPLEDPGWVTLPLAWDELQLVQIQPVHTYSTLLPCNEKERMKLTGGGWERTYECIITMDVLCKLLHSPLLSRCVFIFQVALELLPEAWTGCPEAAAPQKPCRIQRSVWDRISCTCPTPERRLSALC